MGPGAGIGVQSGGAFMPIFVPHCMQVHAGFCGIGRPYTAPFPCAKRSVTQVELPGAWAAGKVESEHSGQ